MGGASGNRGKAVVKKIEDNGLGLSAADGHRDQNRPHHAQSGTHADYGNIARGATLVFNNINNDGGFEDSTGRSRRLNFVVKDDRYDAARTIPLVDELIDSERVLAVITPGSPNTMKTYDKLNRRCIPQPLSMTGHPAWGDPVNHPWTTREQMAHNTEAVLLGPFLEERVDELPGATARSRSPRW